MTRGNQRDVDRERAMKRAAGQGSGKSTLKQKDKINNILCNICKQSFMCTAKKPLLEQHVDSKHPKNSFDDCFPNWNE